MSMKIGTDAQGRILLVLQGPGSLPESLNGTALTHHELTEAQAAELASLQAGGAAGVRYTGGMLAAIDLSPEAIAAATRARMEQRLDLLVDATARGMGYNSGLSCASYAGSTNPVFAAEAVAFIAWRDAVWAAAIALMAEVQAGTRAAPTEAELIAAMPTFTRPGA